MKRGELQDLRALVRATLRVRETTSAPAGAVGVDLELEYEGDEPLRVDVAHPRTVAAVVRNEAGREVRQRFGRMDGPMWAPVLRDLKRGERLLFAVSTPGEHNLDLRTGVWHLGPGRYVLSGEATCWICASDGADLGPVGPLPLAPVHFEVR